LRDSINDKYTDEIDKLQEQKDRLQDELDKANKNYNAKTAAASEKAAELAKLESYRDELELIALRNINGPINKTDSNRIDNIFKEMMDAGGELRKAAITMREANPAQSATHPKGTGKSFSQVLVDNLNADVKLRAGDNKTFADAVAAFAKAVAEFKGGTSPSYFDPSKNQKNEKGWLSATAAALGISGDTPFDTSVMVVKNPKTSKQYFIPLDSPRFKDTYEYIVGKGYHFDGWQKTLPEDLSSVYLDPKKLPKLVFGGNVKGYSTAGPVSGPGTGTSDSIIARLSNGEFVTKATSVSDIGVDNMHLVNTMGAEGVIRAAQNLLQGKASGGYISGYPMGGLIPYFKNGGMPNPFAMGMEWFGNTLKNAVHFVSKTALGFDPYKQFNKQGGFEKLAMASMLIPGSSGIKGGSRLAVEMAKHGSKWSAEGRAFQMAAIDKEAVENLFKMDLSKISIPDNLPSVNVNTARNAIGDRISGTVKGGLESFNANDWEIVQALRVMELSKKFPKLDLSDTKIFNELYAKEFYGLSGNPMMQLFKGVRNLDTNSPVSKGWRTSGGLPTYFSTNPYVAAMYSLMLGKRTPENLPMFAMNLPLSKLPGFLGEGAIRNGFAQGSMEFPQAVPSSLLSEFASTIKQYDLPGSVLGNWFKIAKDGSLALKDFWPRMSGGGYIKKFHDLRGPIPGPYNAEVGALVRAKTESIYPTGYVESLQNATMSGGNTYVLKNEIHASEGMDVNQLADVVTKRTIDTIKSIDSVNLKSTGTNRKFGGMISA
jgi:hypothetical protein